MIVEVKPLLLILFLPLFYTHSNTILAIFYYLSEYPIKTTKNALFKGFYALEIDISSPKSTL